MKFFLVVANENWICDRLASEWQEFADVTTNPVEADVVWILSPYIWNSVPRQILENKKVLVTIHHVVPEKFTKDSLREFLQRDKFVDYYHVTCEQTEKFISKITKKPIFKHPFWVNQHNWFEINKQEARQKLNLSEGAYLIGSFQRDTEGHDLKSPKLEKGPDLFCDIVDSMNKEIADLEVLLAGWRRQYVINRLQESGVKYHYFELPELSTVNELYNCLDLYIVSARCEGGPQSIVECALTKTPIVSTDVGIARNILAEESIYNPLEKLGKPNVEVAYNNVKNFLIPTGFAPFLDFIESR